MNLYNVETANSLQIADNNFVVWRWRRRSEIGNFNRDQTPDEAPAAYECRQRLWLQQIPSSSVSATDTTASRHGVQTPLTTCVLVHNSEQSNDFLKNGIIHNDSESDPLILVKMVIDYDHIIILNKADDTVNTDGVDHNTVQTILSYSAFQTGWMSNNIVVDLLGLICTNWVLLVCWNVMLLSSWIYIPVGTIVTLVLLLKIVSMENSTVIW
jgi:hypothetical protein